MHRLLLPLLLLVSLGPSTATASRTVHVQDRISAIAAAPSQAARSAGSLEILQDLRGRETGERPDPFSADPRLHRGTGPSASQILRRSSLEALSRSGVAAPRFEHLPYFATAPPFQR